MSVTIIWTVLRMKLMFKGDFTMKTKMKPETKKRILNILSIVLFIVIIGLIYVLVPENYGWIKY